MPLVSMSEEQARMWGEMMDWWKHRHHNQKRFPEVEPDYLAPEVYVAKTPVHGIPGLAPSPGTGTGSAFFDEPGSAHCQIYRLHHLREPGDGITGTGTLDSRTGELRAVPGLTRRIYNFSSSSVSGNIFVLAIRDKWGTWYLAGGGSTGTVVLDIEPGSGNQTEVIDAVSFDLCQAVEKQLSGYVPMYIDGELVNFPVVFLKDGVVDTGTGT